MKVDIRKASPQRVSGVFTSRIEELALAKGSEVEAVVRRIGEVVLLCDHFVSSRGMSYEEIENGAGVRAGIIRGFAEGRIETEDYTQLSRLEKFLLATKADSLPNEVAELRKQLGELQESAAECLAEKLRAERHAAELESETRAHLNTLDRLKAVESSYAIAADQIVYLRSSLIHLGGQHESAQKLSCAIGSRLDRVGIITGLNEGIQAVLFAARDQLDGVIESLSADVQR